MNRYKRKRRIRWGLIIGVLLMIFGVVALFCWKTSTADAKRAVEAVGYENITLRYKLPAHITGDSCGWHDTTVMVFDGFDKIMHEKKTIEVCGSPTEIGGVTVK